MVIVYVEDDAAVRRAVSRALASITGLAVVQAGSVQELRALELCAGTVLVTDGDVGDGSCGDVVDHVVSVLGPSGIGGTVLLLSGDQPPKWNAQLLAAEQKGVTTERLVKPSSVADLRVWWSRVRTNFGL
jgi:DNA-binding NtrC family response regulator